MSWDQYSETPASNYITGYFLTGMAPSSVKVAGSDIMADLASRFAALHTTGGTANAQTLTHTRQLQALVAGLEDIVIFGNTNTGAMTYAPDGLTAKNVNTNGAGILAGQAAANAIGILKYDGTQWNLLNPSRVTGSFTGTLTGCTTSPTATFNYQIGNDGKSAWIELTTANGPLGATSNSTACTITGVPAILANATSKRIGGIRIEDAGAFVGTVPALDTGTSTVWTLSIGNSVSGFTNTGAKAFLANTFAFTLD